MAPRDAIVCGIEIKKECISLVQYSPGDDAVVNASIIVRPLDDADPSGDDWAVLKTKFRKMTATIQCRGQAAAISLPAEHAVVKKVVLDRDEENVAEAIGWDISQHIIGTLDEYVYDFEASATTDPAKALYLAVAYRSGQVSTMKALLKSVRLLPIVVDLDMFALIDAFEANYAQQIARPAVIVSGGEESSKVILTKSGAFVDFEEFEHGGRHLSPDDYADAVRRTIAANFPKGVKGANIFLSGALFAQQQFCEEVIQRLGNASLLNPFNTVKSKIEIPDDDLVKCLPYLGVSVGLALRGAAEAGI